MPVVPQDLLEQAEASLETATTLPDIPRREALLRTAVSRAYYAAYHAALVLAYREGFEGLLAGYGSHESLWEGWFEERGDEEIARVGHSLKRERTRADYRLRETFSLSGTRAALDDARAILGRVRAS